MPSDAPAAPAVDNAHYGESNEPGDSAYDSEVASYTTSLASNVTEYKIENGRRYHAYKDGSWSSSLPMTTGHTLLMSLGQATYTRTTKSLRPSSIVGAHTDPIAQKENDRLDIMHKATTVMLHGKMHLAPIAKDAQRILDIGTGTGLWAIEMGDAYPNIEILGNDLSPIQPPWVPPNVRFEVDDVEADWTHQKPFDYIHCRYMGAAIRDWARLSKHCFDNTKPGGYTEFIDFDVEWTSADGSLEGREVQKFNQEFIKTARAEGMEPCTGPKLHDWLKAAGFVDIYAERFILPVGTWPADKHLKEVGAWNYLQVMEGLEAFLFRLFTNTLGYSAEEVKVTCAKIRGDMKDPKMHAMMFVHVAYGKKPEGKKVPEK